jgi:hypothetical protein
MSLANSNGGKRAQVSYVGKLEGTPIMLLILLLVVLLIALAPAWPHSRRWGRYRYYPSGTLGAVLLVVIVLVLLGRL